LRRSCIAGWQRRWYNDDDRFFITHARQKVAEESGSGPGLQVSAEVGSTQCSVSGLIMRVLYLTMNPNRESTTVPTEGWFRILRAKGLKPVLVSNNNGAFQEWARKQSVPCYEIPLPFPDRRQPSRFLWSLARIAWIGKRHRIQLVHCNEQNIYPIGQYAARLLRVPVLVSVHFTLRAGFSEWAFGKNRVPNRIFFVSASSREACRPGINIVPEDRWSVLYNGLNLGHYRPDDHQRQAFRRKHSLDGAVLIGAACALRPRKQLEHLFEAVSRVARPSIRLVLAGGPVSGDEDYAAKLLEEGYRRLGNRFLYLGHQSELRPLYNAMDLFVNTSREEAFGLSVLEAMACGCPVLGYPSISVAEVVLPSGGEIVPQDNVNALAVAIEAWATTPERLQQARSGARQRAEQFDIDTLADQLWNEYESVLVESKN
jgi:glycosyltransferase involved in cell wall biosynthesis